MVTGLSGAHAGNYKLPEEAERVGCIVGAGLGGLETIEKTAKLLFEHDDDLRRIALFMGDGSELLARRDPAPAPS